MARTPTLFVATALLALFCIQDSHALRLRVLDEPEEDMPYSKEEMLAIMQDLEEI